MSHAGEHRSSQILCEEEEQLRNALKTVPPPPPPEGGWGWVILAASFLSYFIVDGIAFTTAVLASGLREQFEGTSYTGTSMVSALLIGTYLLTGPLAIALSNTYGCRRVAIIGSILTTVAFLCSVFAHSLPVFIVFFSVLGGVGFGLIYLPAIVTVGFYFESRRALATCIAVCGSGLGICVGAPVLSHLSSIYDWRYAVVISAGIALNACVLGSLYRPLDAKLKRREKIILQRLEQDKRIGWRTCNIMVRLLEEKRRQKTLSTGSLDDTMITNDNTIVKQWQHLYSPAVGRRGRMESVGSRKGILGRIKEKFSRSQVNVAGLSQTHIKANLQNTPVDSSTTLSSRHCSVSGSPCHTAPPEIISASTGLPNGSACSSPKITPASAASPKLLPGTTPPSTPSTAGITDHPVPTIIINSCHGSPVKSVVGMSSASMEAAFERTLHFSGRSGSVKSLPSPIPSRTGTSSNFQRDYGDVSSDEGEPAHAASVIDVLLGNNNEEDFSAYSTPSSRRRCRHKRHHHRYSSMEEFIRFRDSTPDVDRPLYRQDIFFGGSVAELPEYKHTKTMEGYIQNITDVPDRRTGSSNADGEKEKGFLKACLRCLPLSMKDMLLKILDFSSLKSPTFLCLCFSSFLTFLGFFIPIVFIMEMAEGAGCDSKLSPWLLSVFGLATVIGRVVATILKEMKCIDSLIVNNVSLIFGGASTLLVPFFNDFSIFVGYIAIFGLCAAAFISLRSVIIMELMGMPKLTSSYGQLFIIQGLAVIMGVPFGGLMVDLSGNMGIPFYFSGAVIALSGIVCFPLRKIARWERKKNGLTVLEYSGDLSYDSDDIKATKEKASNSNGYRYR